jgi:hypothetical protein
MKKQQRLFKRNEEATSLETNVTKNDIDNFISFFGTLGLLGTGR